MVNLETTNLILAIMAAASVLQLILLVAAVAWAARQIARLRQDLAGLQAQTEGLVADLRSIASRADGVGREFEKIAVILQHVARAVGNEVERATSGVGVVLDIIEALYHSATAVGEALRSGLGEILLGRLRRHASGTPRDAAPDDPPAAGA